MLAGRLGASIAALALTSVLSCNDEPVESRCSEATRSASAAFSARCFDNILAVETDPASPDYGRVPCTIYATFPAGSAECACDRKGYAPVTRVPDTVFELLEHSGGCEQPCCPELCLCEFLQLEGAELAACQSGTELELSAVPVGWCYVSPEQGIGSPEVVEQCDRSEKRLIRILPFRHNLTGVISCQSAATTLQTDGG